MRSLNTAALEQRAQHAVCSLCGQLMTARSESALFASGRSWDAESWLFESVLDRAPSLFTGIEEQQRLNQKHFSFGGKVSLGLRFVRYQLLWRCIKSGVWFLGLVFFPKPCEERDKIFSKCH